MATLNVTYNPFKVAFWVLLAIFAILLLSFLKGCFKPKVEDNKPVLVKEKHDTSYPQQPTVVVQPMQPIIIKSDQAAPTVIPQIYREPSTDIKELTAQVKELAAQFYAINHYKDSIQLHDSSGKRVGVVNLEQDISQNKIQNMRPSYTLSFPVINNSKEYIIPTKLKNQWFYGGGTSFALQGVFKSVDAGISVINKKGQMIQVSAEMFNNITFGGRIGYSHKF